MFYNIRKGKKIKSMKNNNKKKEIHSNHNIVYVVKIHTHVFIVYYNIQKLYKHITDVNKVIYNYTII